MFSYCLKKWGLTPKQILNIEPMLRNGKSQMLLEMQLDAICEIKSKSIQDNVEGAFLYEKNC